MQTLAEARKPQPSSDGARAPRPDLPAAEPRREGAAGRALMAGAMFATGLVSYVLLDESGPLAPLSADGSSARAEGASLPAQDPLVPFFQAGSPSGADGLVAFAGAAPIVNEGPVREPVRLTGAWLRAEQPAPAAAAFGNRIGRANAARMIVGGLLAGLRRPAATQEVSSGRIVDFQAELEARAPGGGAQAYDPLVLDLEGTGEYTSGRPTRFDLEGDGRLGYLRDIAPSAGVLVFDADGDGTAGENGLEVFGDRSDLDGDGRPDGYQDGFDALAAMVRKAESAGVLPAGTAAQGRLSAAHLAALGRAYRLGIRVGSLGAKTVPLAEAGVRLIALSDAQTVRDADFDGRGNDAGRRDGAYFVDAEGVTRDYQEIFLAYNRAQFRRLVARF